MESMIVQSTAVRRSRISVADWKPVHGLSPDALLQHLTLRESIEERDADRLYRQRRGPHSDRRFYFDKSDTWENNLLLLLLNNTNSARIGDATGLRGSSTAGSLYYSLHTADPGEAGGQSTNETAYTNYARVAGARSSAGFTVSGNSGSNTPVVTFPTCGTTGATLTHAGLGTDSSGASGYLLYSGALTSNLIVSQNIAPEFAAAAFVITES